MNFASRRLVRPASAGVVRTYPLSEKMGVRIQQYTGQKFITTCRKPAIRIRTIRCLPGVYSPGNAHRLGAYLADAA